MVIVEASDGLLRVELRGSDAFWAFKRRLGVSLHSVREVRVADNLSPWLGWRDNELGLRLPGTALPWLFVAGSYWRGRGKWTFCCLHRGQRALVVDLEPGAARYRRLVLGVEDPDVTRRQIESAR
jgi:hypothetical protein